MAKTRSGYLFQDKKTKNWWARVTYTGDDGKRRNLKRRVENKTAGKELLKVLLRELDDNGPAFVDAAKMTFQDLASYYRQTYLIEPEYVGGRKVAGLRSHYGLGIRLTTLADHFGKKRLRDITYSDLERFRTKLLKSPKKRGGQRSITTVNRHLQLLRAVLNVAKRNGWIARNPFEMGDSLISVADEKKRERVLTREEEARLLAACDDPRRSHIRPIVICGLDTGMRAGEIIKLRWSDVDFANRIVLVRAMNTKTMRERQIALTARLESELKALYQFADKEDVGALVFGIKDNFKKAFMAARKAAGLPDVRFHDLRHCYASRLVGRGVPLAEVQRVIGHTQLATTFRYTNSDLETARKVANVLDEFNQQPDEAREDALIN